MTDHLPSCWILQKYVSNNRNDIDEWRISRMFKTKQEDNKQFWSRSAKIYEIFVSRGQGAKRAYREMNNKVTKNLSKHMNVLELAAGPAILSEKIALSCESLEATDFSEKMIEEAKKKKMPANVHFAIADATDLIYDKEEFDAVVIANALHIMPHPEIALSEISRVLKRDGILIAPTFIRENVNSKIVEKFMEFFGFRTYSKWTHTTYQQYLESQGWIIMKEEIMKGHNFPISFVVAKRG